MNEQQKSRGELLLTKEDGDSEYFFYRDPDGHPKGQVKVWARFRIGVEQHEDRVPFQRLPKPMQEQFLAFAGKVSEAELAW